MSTSAEANYVFRLSDVVQHSEQSLQPIAGYEKEPLLPLAQAVEPLHPLLKRLDAMIACVQDHCKTPLHSLSREESASIMLYTLGWSPIEESFYVKLNNVLRSEDRESLKPWFRYLKLFLTALSKLPSKNVNVYRGVKADISSDYPEGKEFVWWAFTSCTSALHVLNSEVFLGKDEPRVLFAIACYSGKDISEHSKIRKENEVLLPAARKFRVLSNLDQNHGLHIIQLEEIEPKPPLLAPPQPDAKDPPPSRATNVKNYRNVELEGILSKCRAKKLDLRGKSLNDCDMALVVKEGLLKNECSILDLSGIEVTSNGISILADALPNNTHLQELDLSGALISDSGVRLLAAVINSSALKHLHLEANDISDEGAAYLAEMFQTNTKLIQLCLSVNQITSSGIQPFAQALTLPQICLQSLDFSANEEIDDNCIDSLVTMLELNRSLKKLDLRSCHFSEDSKTRLRAVVKSKASFDLRLSF